MYSNKFSEYIIIYYAGEVHALRYGEYNYYQYILYA